MTQHELLLWKLESLDFRLDRIERLLVKVLKKEDKLMAFGQDILDAVTAETTAVDSFIALVDGLVKNNTISPAMAAQIVGAVNADRAKLEAAILANTPPPTP